MDRFKIKWHFDHVFVWNRLEGSVVNVREAGGGNNNKKCYIIDCLDRRSWVQLRRNCK